MKGTETYLVAYEMDLRRDSVHYFPPQIQRKPTGKAVSLIFDTVSCHFDKSLSERDVNNKYLI